MAPKDVKPFDLVCEGGGVRGVGLVGALAVLEEEGYEARYRAGTSAGAIVATLHAAGYTARELRKIVTETSFKKFMDPSLLDRVPFVGPSLSVLQEHGIYEGDEFYRWFATLLESRGVHTFADLVASEDETGLRRHKVQVIASDLSERRLLVLPRDAAALGIEDPDSLEVALAVRMSMAIPIFFEPVRFENPQTGHTHVIVDGGLLSNFPVWLFDVKGRPAHPTFGLRLVEEDASDEAVIAPLMNSRHISKGPVGLVLYSYGLLETLLQAHDRLYIEQAHFARTIPIPTGGISAIDFGLSSDDADRLYRAGRKAAREFLAERWDFESYCDEYRSGIDHSRSADLAELLA